MKTFSISGQRREKLGKTSASHYRNEGYVPCELYGQNGNIHFSVYISDFQELVYTPDTYRVQLNIDGEQYDTVMKEIQFHPLSDVITHVDFYQIDENKPMKLELPIRFIGTAAGAREGGKFVKKLRSLKVKGFAKDMPDAIEIDIADLGLGKSIKVRDIVPANGVEIINAPAIPVATVEVPRGMRGKINEEAADTKGKKK